MTGLGLMTSPLFEGRRPSPISTPPTSGETKKLRERLLKYGKDHGRALTPAACEFLASAVDAPQAIRQQLNRPTIRPTATGWLEVIYATVPVDCLAPDPTNGRVVGATAWPAADADDNQTLKLWAPADMQEHPESSCEVLLRGDSVDRLKTILQDSASHTKSLNGKMKGKIERDGVLDPLLCQIVHVETLDGERGIALVTRDGSTRCSFAVEAHGKHPHDAFFGEARNADMRRQRWLEMNRRSRKPLAEILPDELVELRTFLVPVQVVIGFHSEDPSVTSLDAVDDIVRRTHVEITHPWQPIAQSNSEADKVLVALRNGERITEDQFLLYGGKLSRAERIARRLRVEPDEVLADLMQVLGASETRRGPLDELHQTMRAVDGRGQVRNTYKAQLAGALGLREFNVDPRSRGTAHLTLGDLLALDALWTSPWKNTKRSPDALKEAALAEIDANEPGPACRELAVKAAGHLAACGTLKRESRDPHGGHRDQRPPETVLDIMYRTRQGIHVLAEALVAGRRGTEPNAVTEDGETIEVAAGDLQPMTNQWIRESFDSPVDQAASSDLPVGAVAASTPYEQVAGHVRAMTAAARELERQLQDAERVRATDGTAYLDTHGWSPSELTNLVERLHDIQETLTKYRFKAEFNPAAPHAQQISFDVVAESEDAEVAA